MVIIIRLASLHRDSSPVFEGDFDEATEDSTKFSHPMKISDSLKLYPRVVYHESGEKTLQKQLERKKKLECNKDFVLGERQQSNMKYYSACSIKELEATYGVYKETREKSRAVYFSKARMKHKRKYELSKQKFIDKHCSFERNFVSSHDGQQNKKPVMFVGDRGFGVGSALKKHRRYGGAWYQKIHGRYTPVCVTNEWNTSQTCIYCFHKIEHPLKLIKDKAGKNKVISVNGTFQCGNKDCISYIGGQACHARDKLSAVAIALKGLSTLLFGSPLPPFDHNISYVTDLFNTLARSFSAQETGDTPAGDAGDTQGITHTSKTSKGYNQKLFGLKLFKLKSRIFINVECIMAEKEDQLLWLKSRKRENS